MQNEKTVDHVFTTLKLTFGLVPIVAGLDKFTNLLTDWTQYLHPVVERMMPISGGTFMHIVGLIEIAAGALVLSKHTRLGAYVVAGWLVAIALSLVGSGTHLDVAVRDIVMGIAAVSLAKLAEARATQESHDTVMKNRVAAMT